MDLERIRTRLQAVLDGLRGPVPPHVEVRAGIVEVHCGFSIELGPGTDWGSLLLELAEVDRGLDDDVRWDEVVGVLERAAGE